MAVQVPCGNCRQPLACGLRAGEADCWCAALPPLTPLPGRDCLCPDCLALEVRAQAERQPPAG